jgi:WD40 repeat protein
VATRAGHSIYVYSVAFHPTAPLLATGSWDDTLKLWR